MAGVAVGGDSGGGVRMGALTDAVPATVTASSPSAPPTSVATGPIVNVPNFQPNSSFTYPAGFLVQVAGVLYSRLGAGQSGASWAADAANWQPIAGSVTRAEVAAGNLGAAYGPAITNTETWITGTLTANIVITLTNVPAGGIVRFILSQDATGGRTVSISNSVTSQAVTVPQGAGALVAFDVYTPDGSNLYIQGPSQLIYQLSASNAAWPVPPGVNTLEVIAWGGYGGGGGGGSCITAIAQSGGSGGGLPVVSRQIITVSNIANLNITIGAGGSGGAGGAAGAANAGATGGYGGDTTVTAAGINIRSYGGGAGRGGAAASTSQTQVMVYGAKPMGGGTTTSSSVGTGGLGTPTGGVGSPPFDVLMGGGGGGGSANAAGTLGGGAGGSGGPAGVGTGGAQGASATADGVDSANTTGGAGGGGGGGANGGRGGNGAAGGGGGVILRVVG